MSIVKPPKNPINSLPFFYDPEDPYPFQTYMFQVFRNLAVAQSTQVESMTRELLSWVLQEWWIAIDKAMTKHNEKKMRGVEECSVEVSREMLEFTYRAMAEMRGKIKRVNELVPEERTLFDELKANGLTPKSPEPKEMVNPLRKEEVVDTATPLKDKRKKPSL